MRSSACCGRSCARATPRLPQVDAWLDRLDARLKGRSSVARLSTADRERLDGTAGQLLELLAPIATIAEPRRTS